MHLSINLDKKLVNVKSGSCPLPSALTPPPPGWGLELGVTLSSDSNDPLLGMGKKKNIFDPQPSCLCNFSHKQFSSIQKENKEKFSRLFGWISVQRFHAALIEDRTWTINENR